VAKSIETIFKEAGLTPRPGQLEAAEKLSIFVEQGKRTLFSAPTGWGKTIVILAALVKTGAFPVLWLVRSLALGGRIREDADRWGLYTYVAAGREKTCPLAEEKGDAIHDFCKFFRIKCPYARLPPSLSPLVTSWEELVARGEREGWCPYYAQDLVQADITVQSYWRRRRPARAIVVDEAHNLLTPQEKVYTVGDIAEAVAAVKEYGATERLRRSLQEVLHHVLTVAAAELRCELRDEELEELRRLYFEALERGDARLRPLVEMARAAAVYVEAERVFFYRPPLSIAARPCVYVSATLPPEAATLLRADVEVRVPWSVKPRAIVEEGVTTKYEEYDVKMAERYRLLLVKVGKQYRRVLVFAASERVARDLRPWVHYEECQPPEGWEGVLLLRARGRFSEGVDIPADAVLVAGAPYLPPQVGSKLAQAYKRMGYADPLRAAVDTPMLIATLQCIGRAWRDPQRPPTVYLADYRYRRYTDILSEYLELA